MWYLWSFLLHEVYHPKVMGEEPVWDNPLFFIIFFPLCPGFSLQAIILLCTTLELLETLASAAAALREESLLATSHLLTPAGPSRNHRMIKTGRDFWRWSRPTPYWSRDTWRLAQDRVQALSPWSGLPHGICSPRYCLLPSNCSSRALHRVRPGDQHPVHHENLGFCPGFSLPVIAQQLWNALLTDVYI